MTAIIVHGGAGRYTPGEEHEQGLLDAVDAAARILDSGGAAMDAVEAAVVSMEDAPVFNAGYGSSINLAGLVQNDATVMLDDLSCGSVAALTAAANPIRAARLVMERTDHVMLAGEGADEFVRRMGLPARDQRSPARLERYEKLMARLRAGEEPPYLERLSGLMGELGLGTVGAVALDDAGHIAAGTSTGGTMLKLPGRVGDAGMVGAGTYASRFGGVSATGHGEAIARHVMAKVAVDGMEGLAAEAALEKVLRIGRENDVEFGIIGISSRGDAAQGYTTQGMSWASRSSGVVRTFMS